MECGQARMSQPRPPTASPSQQPPFLHPSLPHLSDPRVPSPSPICPHPIRRRTRLPASLSMGSSVNRGLTEREFPGLRGEEGKVLEGKEREEAGRVSR